MAATRRARLRGEEGGVRAAATWAGRQGEEGGSQMGWAAA